MRTLEPVFTHVPVPKHIVLGLEAALEDLLKVFRRSDDYHTTTERRALDAAAAVLTDLTYHRAGAAGR